MAQKKAEALPVAKRKKNYKSYGLILKYFDSKMPKSTVSPGQLNRKVSNDLDLRVMETVKVMSIYASYDLS